MKTCTICGCGQNRACMTADGPCAWSRYSTDETPLCTGCTETAEAIAAAVSAARADTFDGPPHFEISDAGVMTALPAWPRDDETTMGRLSMASIHVDAATIATWSDDQCKQADVWAGSVHLSASDNDDIQVPPKPDFLPDYTPFRGIIPDELRNMPQAEAEARGFA